MSINLEGALADLARSVHDDGVTERMNGQVRHMVTRIRRRRAARYSATGVIGVGAAAAVVVGGLQLADRYPASVPPAATDPTVPPASDSASDGLSLECGDRVPADTLRPEWEGFRLELEVSGPAAGSDVPIVVRLVNDGDTTVGWDTDQVVQLAALRDGEIVATGTMPANRGEFTGGDSWQGDQSVSLSSCDGEGGFGAGDYELVASVIFANADGSDQLGLSAGPVRFTITDPSPTEAPAVDAASTIAGWLASPVANLDLVFPMCGTVASDALDDAMPPLELDLVEPDLKLASGRTYEATVRLHTTLGRYVIGNASPNATLVILKDGVVLGYQWLDSEDVTLVDLADGQTLEFPVLGTMNLCGTGEGGSGPLVPLPAGEYRIMAALDVMLKEVGEPGAEAEAITTTITAVSEAGRLTVVGT